MASRDPDDHLPLKPNWFHILLSLADGTQHGYAIMQEVRKRTDGKIRLWPTTVYGSIRRMEEAGMVEPVSVDEAEPADDERRRSFGLTEFGREVLLAETRRLRKLVDLAQAITA